MTIIQKLIKASGKTQVEISKILNVPESRISEYKRNRTQIPFDKVKLWCEKLKIDLKDII